MSEIKFFPNPQNDLSPSQFKTQVDAYLAGLPAGTNVEGVPVGAGLGLLYGGGITGTASGMARTAVADVNHDVVDGDVLIAYETLTAGRAVNLPAVADAGVGRTIIVADEAGSADTNNISVTPDGAEEIDGVAAAVVIDADYGFLMLYCTGTAWKTLAKLIA